MSMITIMGEPQKKSVAEEPMEIKMTGYKVVEKIAKPCATSARILVPDTSTIIGLTDES